MKRRFDNNTENTSTSKKATPAAYDLKTVTHAILGDKPSELAEIYLQNALKAAVVKSIGEAHRRTWKSHITEEVIRKAYPHVEKPRDLALVFEALNPPTVIELPAPKYYSLEQVTTAILGADAAELHTVYLKQELKKAVRQHEPSAPVNKWANHLTTQVIETAHASFLHNQKDINAVMSHIAQATLAPARGASR